MSVSEVNFSFGGLHCLKDFGCIFIEADRRVISAESERAEYDIAGMSGTLLLDDREKLLPYEISGTLVPMQTPPSWAAAQQLCRRIGAWLKGGRKELVWDYEREIGHMAEVRAATEWGTAVWFEGGLDIVFLVQPLGRARLPVTASAAIAGSGEVQLRLYTDRPCGVDLTLTNTGSAAITEIAVQTENGATVALDKSLHLAAGACLEITMTPPIGAAITANGAKTSALRHASQFDPLTISGPESISIRCNGTLQAVAAARSVVV